IAPPLPNRPWCGRAPRTVPLACTGPRRSPPREHRCPDSSRLRHWRPTPSGTPLPRSPLPPLHNPPPSPHPVDPRFAVARPNVRPSPFPPQQTDPEPQSPFWAPPDSLLYQILEDLSSMRATPGEHLIKAGLVVRIDRTIRQRKLTQAAAARLMGIDQPKVSAMLVGQFRGY